MCVCVVVCVSLCVRVLMTTISSTTMRQYICGCVCQQLAQPNTNYYIFDDNSSGNLLISLRNDSHSVNWRPMNMLDKIKNYRRREDKSMFDCHSKGDYHRTEAKEMFLQNVRVLADMMENGRKYSENWIILSEKATLLLPNNRTHQTVSNRKSSILIFCHNWASYRAVESARMIWENSLGASFSRRRNLTRNAITTWHTVARHMRSEGRTQYDSI